MMVMKPSAVNHERTSDFSIDCFVFVKFCYVYIIFSFQILSSIRVDNSVEFQ